MGFLEFLRIQALALPALVKFALLLGVVVFVPRLSQGLRIPAVVGLMLSGVALGPHVLELFGQQAPVADFFGELGKLLLMFLAGLEIDMSLFAQARARSLIFGVVTTGVPLLFGTAVGLWFGYPAVASVVLGSLLASHTLLAVPVIRRLGETQAQPFVVTAGATVLSDTLSLIVFAVCVSVWQTGFSAVGISLRLAAIALFFPLIVFGLGRLGSYALRKVEKDEDAHFLLILVVLSIAAVLAQAVELPGIVGAFLAGLAVNRVVRGKPGTGEIKFLGEVVFIPAFFIVTGFLIDPRAFLHSLTGRFPLTCAVVLALVVGKWIAAEAVGRAFGYTPGARRTMWSLTLPQVAATLAATLVAYQTFNASHQRLLDGGLLHVVLALVLITSIVGPVLTERFAPRMLRDGTVPLGTVPLSP
jgi:Kef-type K+ transport system membrane component KefB